MPSARRLDDFALDVAALSISQLAGKVVWNGQRLSGQAADKLLLRISVGIAFLALAHVGAAIELDSAIAVFCVHVLSPKCG